MTLMLKKMTAIARNRIPTENETIYDDFDIIIENVLEIEIGLHNGHSGKYFTEDMVGWVIDIIFTDGRLCINLPKEMTKEQVLRYTKPFTDDCERIGKERKEKLH